MLDLLEDAAASAGTIDFVPSGARSWSELWSASARSASWFRRNVSAGETVAMVLSSTEPSLVALVGAWRAGLTVASLPARAPGLGASNYRALIQGMCAASGAQHLLADHGATADFAELGVEVLPFEACTELSAVGPDVEGGRLVQFSSGSTGAPKGVVLTLAAIEANILAILAALDLGPEDKVCSWLPLTHDMGLIGMTLAPIAAFGRRWCGGGGLVTIPTKAFIANPSSWMRACAANRTTITTAPDFGYAIATRFLQRSLELDLRPLRACLVGSEPVSATTLRTFSDIAARHGFDPMAFCPTYGLAEATLGVTLVRPYESWSSRRIRVHEGSPEPIDVVSCGPPLAGVDVGVRDADASGTGRLVVRSPALLEGYLDGTTPVDRSGWMQTQDVGRVIGGETYVVGRDDDVVFVAGRKLHASELEAAAMGHESVDHGRCVAVASPDGGYAVIAERPRGRSIRANLDTMCRSLRTQLTRSTGAAPALVGFTAPGSLPRTPSGKLRRRHIEGLLRTGDLHFDEVISSTEPRRSRRTAEANCDADDE